MTQIVDLHHHVIPDFYWEASNEDGNAAGGITPPRWSLDGAIAYLDEAKIDVAVPSISTPGVHFGDDAAGRTLARRVNEYLADIKRERPDRFGGFAALPLRHPIRSHTRSVCRNRCSTTPSTRRARSRSSTTATRSPRRRTSSTCSRTRAARSHSSPRALRSSMRWTSSQSRRNWAHLPIPSRASIGAPPRRSATPCFTCCDRSPGSGTWCSGGRQFTGALSTSTASSARVGKRGSLISPSNGLVESSRSATVASNEGRNGVTALAIDPQRSATGRTPLQLSTAQQGCYLPVTCPSHAASWKPVERGSSGSSPAAQ
jgi:hypothetical protein